MNAGNIHSVDQHTQSEVICNKRANVENVAGHGGVLRRSEGDYFPLPNTSIYTVFLYIIYVT